MSALENGQGFRRGSKISAEEIENLILSGRLLEGEGSRQIKPPERLEILSGFRTSSFGKVSKKALAQTVAREVYPQECSSKGDRR